ncbi:MAG: LysE family translocator [Desulfobacterales bacterium]|nr:LysE family translocator [Desulfobacterales bacterium]
MIDSSVIIIFIPTFFFVSVTPGLCMTLALSMGMTIGVRKTFYMMWGELAGVALVAIASVSGVAALMLNYSVLFIVLKYAGGMYLFYLGFQMLRAKNDIPARFDQKKLLNISKKSLMFQGFITAIANPKGWAFMISLLPPFINSNKPLIPQLSILVGIILITEFTCLILYSNGGRTLSRFLGKKGNIILLNCISGLLMMGVGIWLAFG